MTDTTNTTKQFIAEFNFADPDWSSLPPNFPNLPKVGLTREEHHLLDGAILAWTATAGGWKKSLTVRKHGQALLVLAVLISLAILISRSAEGQLANPVQAATLKVNEAFESTMSAVLRTVR